MTSHLLIRWSASCKCACIRRRCLPVFEVWGRSA